jgi:hypothetical protein
MSRESHEALFDRPAFTLCYEHALAIERIANALKYGDSMLAFRFHSDDAQVLAQQPAWQA